MNDLRELVVTMEANETDPILKSTFRQIVEFLDSAAKQIRRLEERVRHRDSELVRISMEFRNVKDEIVDVLNNLDHYVDDEALQGALYAAINRR